METTAARTLTVTEFMKLAPSLIGRDISSIQTMHDPHKPEFRGPIADIVSQDNNLIITNEWVAERATNWGTIVHHPKTRYWELLSSEHNKLLLEEVSQWCSITLQVDGSISIRGRYTISHILPLGDNLRL